MSDEETYFEPPLIIDRNENDSKTFLERFQRNPFLTCATIGFFGIAGYRIYKIRSRGGMKLSFFLIHTRLAAQGFGVAVLGSLVFYEMAQRAYKSITEKNDNQINE